MKKNYKMRKMKIFLNLKLIILMIIFKLKYTKKDHSKKTNKYQNLLFS